MLFFMLFVFLKSSFTLNTKIVAIKAQLTNIINVALAFVCLIVVMSRGLRELSYLGDNVVIQVPSRPRNAAQILPQMFIKPIVAAGCIGKVSSFARLSVAGIYAVAAAPQIEIAKKSDPIRVNVCNV